MSNSFVEQLFEILSKPIHNNKRYFHVMNWAGEDILIMVLSGKGQI